MAKIKDQGKVYSTLKSSIMEILLCSLGSDYVQHTDIILVNFSELLCLGQPQGGRIY